MTHMRNGGVKATLAVLSIALLGTAAPAAGQTDTNRRVRTAVSVQGQVGGDSPWRWASASIVRARYGAGTLDFLAGQAMLTRDLTQRSRAGFGYAYGEGFPDAGSVREHQFFQQYTWSAGGSWRVSLTSRLEERFVTGHDAMRLRFRQQVRVTWPLVAGGQLRGVVSEEVLAAANSTAGASRGFDSNRMFVGIGQALTTRSAVEIGYLNVYSQGGASRERTSHVISATLVVSL